MHGLDSLPRALRACWCAGLESDVMHIDIDTGHMDTETHRRIDASEPSHIDTETDTDTSTHRRIDA